jgi:hypothetical protein
MKLKLMQLDRWKQNDLKQPHDLGIWWKKFEI